MPSAALHVVGEFREVAVQVVDRVAAHGGDRVTPRLGIVEFGEGPVVPLLGHHLVIGEPALQALIVHRGANDVFETGGR